MGWRKDFAKKDPHGQNWQMPQGGIDDGEHPQDAALRELHEETNVTSIRVLGQSADWLTYDLPAQIRGKALKGRYRGQKQKWFVLAFDGDESEIDVLKPGGGLHKAEFSDWKWVDFHEVSDLIVPFKRHVYEALVAEFGPMIAELSRT